MKLKRILICVMIVCLAALVFAGCAGTPTEDGSAPAGSAFSLFIPLIVLFAVMYFMTIRPENKRRKKAQEMRESIEVGDKITTIGGIIGKVVHVTSDRITFETGEDRVRIEVNKWAISSNEGKGANKETTDSEEVLNG